MSEPSNIRINPFVGDGGTTTYINLTETHIIPSVSPYVIRLNEVPEKQDPSNIRAVWVDSSTGAVTASALTEVAATPAAGEFRPDYATKADGNDNWNTGLIEFSAVDAGKIVQISYTGMGTLAAVQSNKYPSWYTDRGDGSDGDFMPEADCTISGVKNYKSVFIKEGVTVTIDLCANIFCQGAFANLGTINGAGKGVLGGVNADYGDGYKTKSMPGENGNSGGNGGMGGGEIGGSGCIVLGQVIPQEMLEDVLLNVCPAYMTGASGASGYGHNGGGGNRSYPGKGGNAGAGLRLVCNSFANKGKITLDGEDGGNAWGDRYVKGGGGGGGGGGALIVICNTANELGTITVAGGKGGKGCGSGAIQGSDGTDGMIIIKQLGAL
jgi:hypothetical protein